MAKLTLLTALVAASALVGPIAHAFQPTARVGGTAKPSSTSLGMAPRFDKATQKWFPTDAEVRCQFLLWFTPCWRSKITCFNALSACSRRRVRLQDMALSAVSTELDPSPSFSAFSIPTPTNRLCSNTWPKMGAIALKRRETWTPSWKTLMIGRTRK
ncbi:hypothetical protein ACHAWF_010165 [Thalassiosira exigua]